jgi:DNA-binding transcriptional regulator LsrR (DeoR family)
VHLETFAGKAAPYLLQELRNAEITLITYGRTLQLAIERTHFPSLGQKFEVYPACCDPFQYSHEPWSSSALALWITQRRGLPTQHHPSLAGLLPVIDPNEVLEARKALAKYVVNAPDYKKIYGPGGLAEKANCLITSIGRSTVPWTLGDDYFVKNIGIDRGELTDLIEAEIGSVPVPRLDLDAEERKRFETIDNARLGLSLKNIEEIARKAMCGPAPGVIVLALGANKALCLLELVKRGLVNRAIVDNKLEAELAKRL